VTGTEHCISVCPSLAAFLYLYHQTRPHHLLVIWLSFAERLSVGSLLEEKFSLKLGYEVGVKVISASIQQLHPIGDMNVWETTVSSRLTVELTSLAYPHRRDILLEDDRNKNEAFFPLMLLSPFPPLL